MLCFHGVQVQNEQCQSIEEAENFKWPPLTEEGKWRTQTVQLRTGINVLQWKTIGVDRHRSKPVLIKQIEISGVAYTSSCTPCHAGTYSHGGNRLCSECPKDTYSTSRAGTCSPCPLDSHYAPVGSPECILRPPCTANDYYEIHTPCDSNNQTQQMYRWVEPKICREDLQESVPLPLSGQKRPCPPCNPGMQYRSSGCEFCPRDLYSDGIQACRRCPPSTTPNYGYQLQWWAEMPPGMSSTCMSLQGDGCSSSDGWQVAGNHIHSSRGHADGAYLVLALNVPGFRGREGTVDGKPLEVGRVSFDFELQCQTDCEFVFMEGSQSKGVTVVRSWTGSQKRQHFSYVVTENDSYTFSWAFQKLQWDGRRPGDVPDWQIVDTDVAKLFIINVTNTMDGGASSCAPCPQGTDGDGCVSCPTGQYIDRNTTLCTRCPSNTIVTVPMPYGEESCKACGPGLTSRDGQSCSTDCIFNVSNTVYDLRALAKPHIVKGSLLFTATGTQYFHLFNLSLCGLEQSQCANNVSYQVDGETSVIKALVCRSTVVPAQSLDGGSPLSTQAVSLGDRLIGVTTEPRLMDLYIGEEFEANAQPHDLHYYYTTPAATRACPEGRSTTITLRCQPSAPGNGTVKLPTKCPDGTCDGCNFHFLWESALACPQCSEKDFKVVRGECVDGKQEIHYLPSDHCIMPNGTSFGRKSACSTKLPFVIEVIVAMAVALACLMSGILVMFWKQHRRLEYKYMKLVQSSSGKEMELPPAESCGLDEGEDDEGDVVQYAQPRGHGIFNKIKSMTGGKSESGNPFETIHLTEKDAVS